MDLFDEYKPYEPLFDENHDGKIDWKEDDRRQDFEDFMNKCGVYEESSTDKDDDLDPELELAG